MSFERALGDHRMAVPPHVIDSSMMDLSLELVAAGYAPAFTPLRQARKVQDLGLWRIVATDHSTLLGCTSR